MLRFVPLTVAEVRPESEDATAVTLEVPAAERATFRCRAGQHIVLRLPLEGAEQRRTYSLVSAPAELPLRIIVRHIPGGRMSQYLARALRAGARLEAMPPTGSFGAHTAAGTHGQYLAIAAGCGITPVFAIIRELLERDRASQVVLLYGNRALQRIMLLEELLALKDRHMARFAPHFFLSRETQECGLPGGRIDAATLRAAAGNLFSPAAVVEGFICGPSDMGESLTGVLRELGVSAAPLHVEHFTAAAAGSAGTAAAPLRAPSVAPGAGLTQVTVTLDGRRRSFAMRTGLQTILEAAGAAGIDLPFSCCAGVCSTCRTKLLSGRVRMDENYALEPDELAQGYILACQARAETPQLELTYDET